MQTEAGPELCPDCGGRGWVVEADGGAGRARRCACQSRGLVPRLLRAAGIPPQYEQCRLANFLPGGRPQLLAALQEANRYVETFIQPEGGGFRQSGLIFVGTPGVGKTHLAVGVLRSIIERYGVQGRFVDFSSLLHQIQSTFDPTSPESKHDVLDPVIHAELLLLDELGAQQPTAWVSDTIYLILNTRYTRRLPTLFTTNYRLESPAGQRASVESAHAVSDRAAAQGYRGPEVLRERGLAMLLERIPASLLSRLYEMAKPVVIEGEDYRKTVRQYSRD
jgi:DNA replication protein DnaC